MDRNPTGTERLLSQDRMTETQKRIEIAKACGWTKRTLTEGESEYYGAVQSTEIWNDPDRDREDDGFDPPDYFQSLDAIHEAERLITDDQWPKFKQLIEDATFQALQGMASKPKYFRPISATAAQRAEAFGLTLKLWTA